MTIVILPEELYEKYVDANTGKWKADTPASVIKQHEECMKRKQELADKGIFIS